MTSSDDGSAPTVAPPRAVQLPSDVRGALWLHAMPGRAEPLDALWAWARSARLDGIVCLAGEAEIAAKSPAYAEALSTSSGPCAIERVPIRDFGVPDDAEAFGALAARIAKRLHDGRRILIHCGAGIGRTGMLAMCVLLAMGYTLADANAAVRTAGSHPETAEQRALVAWWAERATRIEVTMEPMLAVESLNSRFGIPNVAEFAAGEGGLPCLHVTAPAAEARIYLHGAHVTHHHAAGQAPTLFLSTRSRFTPGTAIRGGVPIVFPWFGPHVGHPRAPDHGFARISEWSVQSVDCVGAGVAIVLTLEPSGATRALWRADFRATYRVDVDTTLRLTLEVENRSDAPFTFEEALHTYLAVGDVREASVEGLGGARYVDKTDGMRRTMLPPGPFRPSAETDRVFVGARDRCTVIDPVLGRRLVVDKHGSATTVVWNPWSDNAARMADLGADQWTSMLCVEAANAMEDAVSLAPGARHAMSVVIGAEKL